MRHMEVRSENALADAGGPILMYYINGQHIEWKEHVVNQIPVICAAKLYNREVGVLEDSFENPTKLENNIFLLIHYLREFDADRIIVKGEKDVS